MRHYRRQHLGTLNQRRTKFNGFASAHCEHLIQSDFGADVCRYLFYFQFFTSSNFVLLAAGFYDRVHGNLIDKFSGNARRIDTSGYCLTRPGPH